MTIPVTRQLIAQLRDLLVKREAPPFSAVLKWNQNQARNPAGSKEGGRWAKGGGSGSMYGTRVLPSSTEVDQMPQGLEKVKARARRAGRMGLESRERREARDAQEMEAIRQGGGVAGFSTILNAPTGEGFHNRPRGVNLPELPPEPPKTNKTLEVLSTGSVKDSRPLGGGGINSSVIVTLEDGTEAVYKPERGETWHASFSNTDISEYITNKDFSLAEREEFAFEVDQTLGLGLVPETVLRTDVDETHIEVNTSDDGGGDVIGSYDEDYARSRYDSYREKRQEQVIDEVGDEMYGLYQEAQNEHADEIEKRAEELAEIWNEEIKNYPDSPYGSESALREHPVLPLGSQGPFERKDDKGALEPLKALDDAGVDVEYPLNDQEKDKVRDLIRQKLAEGYSELGDVYREAAKEHLDRDQWMENHADTEMRLMDSKVQSFDAWRHEHGYDSDAGGGGGGGGGDKNPDAPHPRGGSFQRYRDDAEDYGDLTEEGGARLAVLDYVIGTMDRHGHNLMFDGDEPVAIDNGYSMPASSGDDDFTFRSSGVKSWVNNYATVPEDLRQQLHDAVKRTDWQALVDRHPSMNADERRAFLGRAAQMEFALQTTGGLAKLWNRLDLQY